MLSLVFAGSAMATTAIGTLIPILSDAGELRTRFGTYLLAAGAVGEFGPILLITLVFSTQSALSNALILLAFVAIAVVVAIVAVRGAGAVGPRSSARWRPAGSWPSGSRWWRCSRSPRWRPASASTSCSGGSWPGSSCGPH